MHLTQPVVALAITERDTDDKIEIDAEYEEALEEIEDRKRTCKGLEYAGHTTELVTNLLGDVPSIPLVTDTIKVVLSGIAAILHIAKFGMDIAATAMRCGAVNFDEIKVIMDKRFDEVDRRLDKMTQVMEKVTKVVTVTLESVEKTRAEMNWGFKNILATLKNHEIQSILSKINKLSRYFEEKRDEISKLPTEQFVFRLKEEDGILDYLKEVRKPEGLHSDLLELMDKNTNYAIPKTADDTKAFQALYALFYGTQTYTSVMFFLLKQHSYLADYYYQRGHDKAFNHEFDVLVTSFYELKSILSGKNGLISKVIDTLDEVKNKPFIKDVIDQLYQDISQRQNTLKELQSNIANVVLDVIEDVPEPVLDIDFDEPVIPSNYGDWIDKSKVRYAVQLRKNGTYSKFSEWTEPVKVEGKANPFLKVPRDELRRERLVFRKFNDDAPQLAGILTMSQMEFRDIDRDVYNAAKSKDQTRPLQYLPALLNANAYINENFELNRSVMHAAAESGNVKIALGFLLDETQDDLLNRADEKGFTPMHIAAETKNAGFINFLISHNADVNAQTTSELLTPLHLVARKGYSNAVNNLLSSDRIDINKPDISGYTPLHYAVRGTTKTVRILLANSKILVNAKSEFGLTPFHLAVMKGDKEICDALLSSGKVEVNAGNKDNLMPLHFAAMAGNANMIQYLLFGKEGLEEININAVTSANHWTPLHLAIYLKHEDAALELLKNSKTDINVISKEKHTPLQLSIATGQLKVFEELLKKNLYLEAASEKGLTALHVAALRPETEFIEKLLDKNADINAVANDGSTALHLASKADKTDQILLLISRGANMKLYDSNKFLPLQYSVKNMNLDVIKAAVEKDPSIVDDKTKEGQSILGYCIDFIYSGIHDYHKNKESFEYRKYKNLQPLEVFNKIGYYDLLIALVNDPSLEQAVNGTIIIANELEKQCLEREQRNEKPCNHVDFRSRRSLDLENMLQQASFMSTLKGDWSKLISLNAIEMKSNYSKNPFPNTRNSVAQSIDTNGMLLLLDLFVRKLTNEKFVYFKEPLPTSESQATSLEIVEKVSDFVDSASDVPAEELMDLAKLHSDVYKSIENGNPNFILDILCEQLRTIVDPAEIETFLSDLMTTYTNASPENQDSANSVLQHCLSKTKEK